MANGKITEARIQRMGRQESLRTAVSGGGNGNAVVFVKYNGGETEEELFRFYDDEIDFNSAEFIGLTKEKALDKKHEKDVKWLRSSSYEVVR